MDMDKNRERTLKEELGLDVRPEAWLDERLVACTTIMKDNHDVLSRFTGRIVEDNSDLLHVLCNIDEDVAEAVTHVAMHFMRLGFTLGSLNTEQCYGLEVE